MNTHFSSFVMYIFELEHAKRYQFFDQGIATNHRCLVVWKRDRNVRATGKLWFKSRRLPRKKKGGGGGVRFSGSSSHFSEL